jgi:hypothetical protein
MTPKTKNPRSQGYVESVSMSKLGKKPASADEYESFDSNSDKGTVNIPARVYDSERSAGLSPNSGINPAGSMSGAGIVKTVNVEVRSEVGEWDNNPREKSWAAV